MSTNGGYKRYKITDSGISPRAVPGVPVSIVTPGCLPKWPAGLCVGLFSVSIKDYASVHPRKPQPFGRRR